MEDNKGNKSSRRFNNACTGTGTVLNTWHLVAHLILQQFNEGGIIYSHFVNGKNEAQKSSFALPGQQEVSDGRIGTPTLLAPEVCFLHNIRTDMCSALLWGTGVCVCACFPRCGGASSSPSFPKLVLTGSECARTLAGLCSLSRSGAVSVQSTSRSHPFLVAF